MSPCDRIDLILKTMPVDDPDFPIFLPRFTDPRSYWTRHHERDEMKVRAAMMGVRPDRRARRQPRPGGSCGLVLSTVQGESPNSVLAELAIPLIDLGIDRIRDLRAIKNDLAVVVLMLDDAPLPVAPPRNVLLPRWIALRDPPP
jgi:hypothetical protein